MLPLLPTTPIVMKKYDFNMEEYLSQKGPVSRRLQYQMLRDTAKGMEYMFHKGLVHRYVYYFSLGQFEEIDPMHSDLHGDAYVLGQGFLAFFGTSGQTFNH